MKMLIAAQDNTTAAEKWFDLQRFAEEPPAEVPEESAAEGGEEKPPETQPEVEANDENTAAEETAAPASEAEDLLKDYKPTLPEGVAIDEESLQAVLPVLKDLGLNVEQSNKLAGVYASKVLPDVAAKVVEDINNTCQKNYDSVMAEIKADKDIGGADFDRNVGQVNDLITKYGATPEQLHTALTALAGFDKDAVKPFFTALQRIANDAADDSTVLSIPRQANTERYPGLPQNTRR